MLLDEGLVLDFNINTDHLILLIIGIVGLIILLLPGEKFIDLDLRTKMHMTVIYIMVFLGFVGLFLIILDLF